MAGQFNNNNGNGTLNPDDPRYRRVRIAVIVQDNGNWSCAGSDEHSDSQAVDDATANLPAGHAEQVYFLEAELMVPAAKQARVEVVRAGGKGRR